VQPLPIDPLLPDLVASLRRTPSLVLEAPPGAGKTTRVPRAMLDAGLADAGEIIVLEPRRLAARLAARRVADELGESLGERVGYTVRFEDQSSARTKIRFVTEGMLGRWLGRRPTLEGVSAVLLDEIHERHLQGDVGLALLRRLQRGARPDLRLIAMSATLDGQRVADFLEAPLVRSEGRRFDVDVRYLERADDRPVGSQVASAVRDLVLGGLDGHVLVFLPGAREIRAATASCEKLASEHDLVVVALHGDLPPDEQDRALAPSTRRKVILSTNVAESSVTIDGVAAVVDAGLHRTMVTSPWTGLSSLRTEKISRASAAQRAGRAGRTRAGVAVRLYTRADHDTRPEHDAPEIARADLAETVLELAAQGVDIGDLPFLDAPPAAAVEAARTLLSRLGAVTTEGRPTEVGRAMLQLPLAPRLSRAVVFADLAGAGKAACTMAAVLAERDVKLEARADVRGGRGSRGDGGEISDVLARVEAVSQAGRERLSGGELRARGLDAGAFFAVRRAEQQLSRALPRRPAPREHPDEETVLLKALLVGFSDRVARRRKPGGRDLVLSGGGSLVQSDGSAVHDAPFVVVCGADGGDGRIPAMARLVSRIEPDWLLELFPERVTDQTEHVFVASSERVESIEKLLYDGLVLDETRRPATPSEGAARVLAEAALAKGIGAFVHDRDAIDAFLARARFVASVDASFPALGGDGLLAQLRSLCEGRTSFAELRAADLRAELEGSLTPPQQDRLRTWAPTHLSLPSGRRADVHYDEGKPPWVAGRMQDFFGTRETPVVGGGRVPMVIHLLAPSSRPVQITQDLKGFWTNHYPALRRELQRKYPRHSWPDDPLAAAPEARPKPRR
jgi:ATP-dependent helicase HrpB